MAAVIPGAVPRRDTVWQRLRAAATRAAVANPLTAAPLGLPPTWAASTPYAAGTIVQNGGYLYECYTAGTSAASGGPAGTGAATITDGTAAWVYAGVAPTTVASPLVPTVTHFNGAFPTGLANRYLPGTNLTDSIVRVVGGSPLLQTNNWRFPCATLFGNQNGGIALGLAGMCAGIEFRTDAPKVAFIWAYPQPFRLFIDGVQVWPGAPVGGTGGGPCGPLIDFSAAGGRKDRLWRVEFLGNVAFYGICVDAASSISYPHASDAVRFVALGDSRTGGGNSFPIFTPDVWVNQLGKRMGWTDNRASGIGGTGYTTGGPGPYPKPIERMSDLTGPAPDIAGFAFGTNDFGAGAAAITAAALPCFQAARTGLPGVPIFVWGTPPASLTLANAIVVENAVFSAVTQANDPLLIPIPVSTDPDPWFTGTGKVSVPSGSGNNDVYNSSDAVHGTNAWHAHWAARSATGLRKIIAARA